jgi:hypothetical protein
LDDEGVKRTGDLNFAETIRAHLPLQAINEAACSTTANELDSIAGSIADCLVPSKPQSIQYSRKWEGS